MSHLELTFEEAAFGCEKEVATQRIENCAVCNGSGSSDGVIETCTQCGGRGQVRSVQNFMGMQMQSTTTCPTCSGRGKIIKNPCQSCRGTGAKKAQKKIEVSIPAGCDDGMMLALREQGSEGKNGGPTGDVILTVNVRPHHIFERDGYDIACEIPITFPEATLGAEIDVPTLEGDVKYTIPEGTQTGTVFTIRGKGIQMLGSKNKVNSFQCSNLLRL